MKVRAKVAILIASCTVAIGCGGDTAYTTPQKPRSTGAIVLNPETGKNHDEYVAGGTIGGGPVTKWRPVDGSYPPTDRPPRK